MRFVSPRDAKSVWNKYVIAPTNRGLYDGKALAPAADMESAISLSREHLDDVYPVWRRVEVGGKYEPTNLRNVQLPEPIAYLPLAIPPFIATLYEALLNKYKESRFLKTWYWITAILISTIVIILFYMF